MDLCLVYLGEYQKHFPQLVKEIKDLEFYIEREVFSAIDRNTAGEARTHAAGRADGANGLKETLLWFREEALKKRGLTDTDLTA